MTGSGIILLNKKDEVLLLLRDNNTSIPYPDMWDIPGGKVEENESPEEAARREMNEEMGLEDIGEITFFKNFTSGNITDYIFWKRIDLNLNEIVLNEGQRIEYFNLDRIKNTKLAFNYNQVLEDFFNELIKDV